MLILVLVATCARESWRGLSKVSPFPAGTFPVSILVMSVVLEFFFRGVAAQLIGFPRSQRLGLDRGLMVSRARLLRASCGPQSGSGALAGVRRNQSVVDTHRVIPPSTALVVGVKKPSGLAAKPETLLERLRVSKTKKSFWPGWTRCSPLHHYPGPFWLLGSPSTAKMSPRRACLIWAARAPAMYIRL